MHLKPLLLTCAAIVALSSQLALAQSTVDQVESNPITVGTQDSGAASEAEAASELSSTAASETLPSSGRVADIAAQFAKLVPKRLAPAADTYSGYAALAQQQLDKASIQLSRDQFVIVVDRNPNVQTAMLFVMGPSGAQPVGAVQVSTGVKGRKDHFITPVGVATNTLDNPSFRAMGTKNSNGFRGYGRKGMRVWDFGWTPAEKGWGNPEIRDIRFQMHATDPDSGEPRLGHPASEGCVRIPAAFNVFADQYDVLDADYLANEAQGNNLWVLPKVRVNTGLAGRYLVVVDSGAKSRPEWAAARVR